MPLVSSARTPTARKKPFIGWVVPYEYQNFYNTNFTNQVLQYTFTVPDYVFELAICCIGGGASGVSGNLNVPSFQQGGGGGGGGALHWRNISVYPGQVLYIQVGNCGFRTNGGSYPTGAPGGESYVKSGSHSGDYLLRAGGGEFTGYWIGGAGGTSYYSTLGGGGANGGRGGDSTTGSSGIIYGGGGGGTGGYTGVGGEGGGYISGVGWRHESTYSSSTGYSGSGGAYSTSAQYAGEPVGPDGVQLFDPQNHFHSSSNDYSDASGFDDFYHGDISFPHSLYPWLNDRYGMGGGGGTNGYSGTSTIPKRGGFGIVRIAYGRITGKSTDVSYPYKASPLGSDWPFSFQGSNYGYTSGGYSAQNVNVIDKFPFASNANATDVGDLSVSRYAGAGQSSVSNGYTSGGFTPPHSNVIDKFSFATDGFVSTDVGNLTLVRSSAAGQSSQTTGYSSGGATPSGISDIINRFPFASNANATDVGDLTVARSSPAGQSSTEYGYSSGGGLTPPTTSRSNVIDKFPFAFSSVNATDVGDLVEARNDTAGQSSSTNGYVSGGNISLLQSTISKFPFASDGNATDVGDITVARDDATGQSSTDYGYTSAGFSPSSTNVIDKFPFASDGNATDVGDLTYARGYVAGQQY